MKSQNETGKVLIPLYLAGVAGRMNYMLLAFGRPKKGMGVTLKFIETTPISMTFYIYVNSAMTIKDILISCHAMQINLFHVKFTISGDVKEKLSRSAHLTTK